MTWNSGLWVIALGEAVESVAAKRRYWHALGAAKPFGYGSVTIRLLDAPALACLRDGAVPDLAKCGEDFAAVMEKFHTWGTWLNSRQLRALHTMSDPKTVWPMNLDYPSFVDFQDYADTNDHVLLPAVPYEPLTRNVPKETEAQKLPPPPPKLLPTLIGQHRVSFKCGTKNSKHGRELWFIIKVETERGQKEKFDAVLRKPQGPALAGHLNAGHQVKLWVVGIENGTHYLLAENAPTQTPTDPPA